MSAFAGYADIICTRYMAGIVKELTVIGLNSGTSMDGIDAAVFTFSCGDISKEQKAARPTINIKMLAGVVVPFETSFISQLGKTINRSESDLQSITLLNTALGEYFARAAIQGAKAAGISMSDIDLIGSHGQTIWHVPDPKSRWGVSTTGTLQLGEPAVIAARTGVTVVADFRVTDMAFGGQGAPLVAFADAVLFGGDGIATGIINIGGIANITIISATNGAAIMAFDTGPGNMIMDRACQVLFKQPFDQEGKIAAGGQVHLEWLDKLLADQPYFARQPPKTTGRELFGNTYADKLIDQGKALKLSDQDMLATLTALTAQSAALAYRNFCLPKEKIARLILAGGGAENAFLIGELQKRWPHDLKIHRHEEFGVSAKFKEALLFALLAYTTYIGIPNNVPACTGAARRVCLGKIIRPLFA